MKTKYSVLLLFLAVPSLGMAQSDDANTVMGLPVEVAGIVLVVGLLVIAITALLIGVLIDFGRISRKLFIDKGLSMPWILRLFGIFEGDNTALTGVPSDAVIEGHDYDGIEEYDNDLPPWWLYLFYATVVFAVVYMFAFHVFDIGKMQEEEYADEIAEAKIKYANTDLVYEAPEASPEALSLGKEMFVQSCASCHLQDGGGEIGPNLTDDYWLNDNNINELYKVIKYGKNNMPSWSSTFNNEQIYLLSSYVLSLHGTTPAKAKEPEGELKEFLYNEDK